MFRKQLFNHLFKFLAFIYLLNSLYILGGPSDLDTENYRVYNIGTLYNMHNILHIPTYDGFCKHVFR